MTLNICIISSKGLISNVGHRFEGNSVLNLTKYMIL